MDGVQIEMCNNDNDNCKLCGYIRSTSKGKWLTVICEETGGFVASGIQFYHPTGHMRICEMQIFGKSLIIWNEEI